MDELYCKVCDVKLSDPAAKEAHLAGNDARLIAMHPCLSLLHRDNPHTDPIHIHDAGKRHQKAAAKAELNAGESKSPKSPPRSPRVRSISSEDQRLKEEADALEKEKQRKLAKAEKVPHMHDISVM